jgi:RHS repeat-associated protein
MLSDGNGHSFLYDAENRLTQITTGIGAGATITTMTYDGFWRRIGITEKLGATTLDDYRYVWDGTHLSQQRESDGTTILKRYFRRGEVHGSDAFFYAKDHLGSIRDLIDGSGALRAEYNYDPWGRQTKVSGDTDADFGFDGYFAGTQSGLDLAWMRVYEPDLGKWLNRDPIGQRGGLNLYGFVGNNPLRWIDVWGWCPEDPTPTATPTPNTPPTPDPVPAPLPTSSPDPSTPTPEPAPVPTEPEPYPVPDGPNNPYLPTPTPDPTPVPAFPNPDDPRGPGDPDPGGSEPPFPTDPLPHEGEIPMPNNGWGFPPPPGGCFVAGTLVHTLNGQQPIEKIGLGDMVMSWDESTSKRSFQRVISLVNAIRKDLVEIYFGKNSQDFFEASSNHLFFVKGKKWIKADQILVGDVLYGEDLEEIPVLRVNKIIYPADVHVFNIEVENYHCYFVGKAEILTHNVDTFKHE